MGERDGQRVAQHLHRRCFENEPPAVYEARFGDDAGLRIFRTQCLNTANEGSSHDTSFDAATGSFRRCRAVHPGDNACLLSSGCTAGTPCWETRALNFTVIALPDCVRLESLEKGNTTFRTECFVVARFPNETSAKRIKQVVNRHVLE